MDRDRSGSGIPPQAPSRSAGPHSSKKPRSVAVGGRRGRLRALRSSHVSRRRPVQSSRGSDPNPAKLYFNVLAWAGSTSEELIRQSSSHLKCFSDRSRATVTEWGLGLWDAAWVEWLWTVALLIISLRAPWTRSPSQSSVHRNVWLLGQIALLLAGLLICMCGYCWYLAADPYWDSIVMPPPRLRLYGRALGRDFHPYL
jgi:hypothetical protein